MKALDATGDGHPDTVTLIARGRRPDSLTIRLAVRVNGKEVFESVWRSDYELVDPPLENPTLPQLDSLIRASLDDVLADVALEPYSTALKELGAMRENDGSDGLEDAIAWDIKEETVDWSAISRDSVSEVLQAVKERPYDTVKVRAFASEIRARRAPVLALAYGYETYQMLAWSPAARRFFVVFECC